MDDRTRSTDPSPVVNRVKRAQGQLAGVLRMMEEGRELDDVLNQLKAVTKALDRAGYAMVTSDLRRQVASGKQLTEADLDAYERHVLSLS